MTTRSARLLIVLILFSAAASAQPVRTTEQIGDETFEVWQQQGDDFAMYCKEPCAAPDGDIQAYYAGFRDRLPQLIDWHGVDVIDELKPVEIHLNQSGICPINPAAAGYAKVGNHRGWENRRGLTCLFEVERGISLAERDHVLSLHEYAHVILFERHRWSYEYFPYWSSWAVVDPDNAFADPCSDWYGQSSFTMTIHRLCKDFGVDQADIRASLIEIDRRFKSGEGYLSNRTDSGNTTTVAELRGLIDARVSADTAPAWLAGGWDALSIGMEFEVGPQAAFYEASEGRISVRTQAGTLPGNTSLRLDKNDSSVGFLPFTHSPHNFAIVTDGQTDALHEETVEFGQPIEFSIEPEPFFLNTQPLEAYNLLERHVPASGAAHWRPVPGSRYEPASGRITAALHRTGHYAYGPAFRAPAGMFYDPALDGHGFDIQMSGDQAFTILFTYDSAGDPLWVLGHAPLGNIDGKSVSAVDIPLYRYSRTPASGELEGESVGRVSFQFYGGWGAAGWEIRANAELELSSLTPDGPVAMRLQPLSFGSSVAAETQVTGHWYDPSDSGWGLTIDRKGDTEITVAYFYDAQGQPRWALGNRAIDAPTTGLDVVAGYCIGCENTGTSVTAAGSVTHDFGPDGRTGRTSLDVAWPATAPVRWQRPEAEIAPLSDPPVYRVDPDQPSAAKAAAAPMPMVLSTARPDEAPPVACAMPHAPLAPMQ